MCVDDGGGVGSKGTLCRRKLARTLRRLREEAGLSPEEAAPKLDWSASKLGRIETADQGVDVHGVRSMLDLYDVGGAQWAEIIDLTREARKKSEWHAYGLSAQGYFGWRWTPRWCTNTSSPTCRGCCRLRCGTPRTPPVLAFAPAQWRALLGSIQSGELY